ncbi:hypothetical protein Acr_01g0011410 [Actinidia rufa]|uniref:Uncharacterized protein n=1 Tax=Actinidia rufa TaxID=165716 RepID=A0A7J0E4X5_9ERIC|nr:hypothetical protein Acr_01g0011410 [Actinidia rufa]
MGLRGIETTKEVCWQLIKISWDVAGPRGKIPRADFHIEARGVLREISQDVRGRSLEETVSHQIVIDLAGPSWDVAGRSRELVFCHKPRGILTGLSWERQSSRDPCGGELHESAAT